MIAKVDGALRRKMEVRRWKIGRAAGCMELGEILKQIKFDFYLNL
jgi:hypothetical protein